MKLHILGAPGSGVSTLGKSIAQHWQAPHFDVDDYHWFTDDPLPYRRRRNPEHRRQLLLNDLQKHQSWVLSGALCGWGDVLIPQFDAVIWLWLPVEIRLARIRAREEARYGASRICPGGDLHTVFEKFCSWAASYDEPTGNIRSREQELAWLQKLACPVFQFDLEVDAELVIKSLGSLSH